MEHLNNKIDKIQEDIGQIKETLIRNTTSLELHMERTKIAEARIEELHDEDTELRDVVHSHINQVKGAAIALTTIATIIFALWQMGLLRV